LDSNGVGYDCGGGNPDRHGAFQHQRHAGRRARAAEWKRQALYSTAALADGASSITAAYSGNGGFLSSDAPALTQLVLDFGFATGSAQSATVFPGQSASFKFAVAPNGAFSDTITFSSSGLPPGASCPFPS
jgi:hypothetical protein